ncbi:MAG: sialate O-acetylesterase [Candidatus Sumerlaeia bacterium]
MATFPKKLCPAFFLVFLAGILLSPLVFAQGSFIQGIHDYQVFPYETTRGKIPFSVKGDGPLTATVTDMVTGEIVARGQWIIDPKARPLSEVPEDASTPLRTSLHNLYIDRVPINLDGDYRVEFRKGSKTQAFEHILIGELWIVGGGIQAIGAPSRKVPRDNPFIHIVKDDKWQEAQAPLFQPYEDIPRFHELVSPWLFAANEYSLNTGIPVGILGIARPNAPIRSFWDASTTEMPEFKSLVEKYGQKAHYFIWYHGGADANPFRWQYYEEYLNRSIEAIRGYAKNPDMKVVVVQMSHLEYPQGIPPQPYLGRIRAAQWRVATNDPLAIMVPSLQFNLRDRFRLREDTVFLLGQDVGRILLESKESRELRWFGPKLLKAQFADETRRRINVEFENSQDLIIKEERIQDWLVSDSNHQGYSEAPAPFERDGILYLDLKGGEAEAVMEKDENGLTRIKLKKNGFIPVISVGVRGQNLIRIDLHAPAEPDAQLWYALWDNSTGSVLDERSRYLGTFGPVPIQKAEPKKKIFHSTQ